ncbi:MAG: hypothetical protein JWN79_2030 [Gemmatimonadetes bacterium]|jgi:hypothetical protein|nr:hypothetical protein [Gemmatimonadota bacterium]
MLQLRTIVLALLLVPAALAAQGRQVQADAFTMSERIPDGQWIRVRNVSGDVRVRPSTSDRVEITATKSWRRGDPKDVRIEMRKASNGSILVCAFWTENATCTENGYDSRGDGGNWRRNNDVAVDFEVRVPKGVRVGAWSVNGSVSVDGVSNEVLAGTVNGSVDAVSAGGPVQASTVNGSVRASMGRLDGTQDLTFSTVNGTVVAEFAGDVDADVDLRTVNGRFRTDWPMTMTGRIDPKHLRATLGKGGRRITLSTVNGNVELRKR